MNFSFELSWALLTGNISPDAMKGMSAVLWAIFWWVAVVRMILFFAILALMIVSRWRVFRKAGLPGWGIFIPFYNQYLMFKMAWRSGRNFLWILFPPVFIVLMIINYFRRAKRFWKHWTYGLGLRFLKVIFIPILAFDNSKYLGKKAASKHVAKVVAKPVAKAPAKKVVKKKAPVKKVKTLKKRK